jgi:uncharacterized cupredoxin-like copper-binding protein
LKEKIYIPGVRPERRKIMYRATRGFGFFVVLMLVGALGLAACSSGSPASKSPVDVQVTLTEFTISSSLTTFKVGVPYHFIVKNEGTVPHEFQIMPPTTEQLTQAQVQAMALAGLGQSDLPAGATATLDYTFTKAYPQGQMEFACHLPGHYEAGMHVPIVVTN